jgi:hypothetical protein
MIAERIVLLRVENLEQSRRRVAAKVVAEFVYLVQHHHGVVDARAPQRLNDATGQRADVCATMPAQLRFVAHSA